MFQRATLPIIIAFALMDGLAGAQSTTYCTSASNLSTGQTISFNLKGVSYDLVQNFITPSDAGVTINGVSYTVYPDTPLTINAGSGAYAEITQINYIPIQPSLDLIVCSNPQTQSTYYQFNLSANNYGNLFFDYFASKLTVNTNSDIGIPANVTMTNATSTAPPPPYGYNQIAAININIATTAATLLEMTQKVSCGLSAGSLAAFELVNGGWSEQINGLSLNKSACSVSFAIPNPNDPTIGVFYSNSQTTTTTTVPATTSRQTSSSTSSSTSTSTSTSTIPTTTRPSTGSSTTSMSSTSTMYQSTTTSQQSASSSTTTTAPASTSPSGSQETASLASYAILAATAMLTLYLIHLIFHRR